MAMLTKMCFIFLKLSYDQFCFSLSLWCQNLEIKQHGLWGKLNTGWYLKQLNSTSEKKKQTSTQTTDLTLQLIVMGDNNHGQS